MNVTLSKSDMAEALCTIIHTIKIFTQYIFNLQSFFTGYSRDKLLKMKIIDKDNCHKYQLPGNTLCIKCEYSVIFSIYKS